MKKILLSIILLYSTISIEQKTISQEDFEHLVDYANCKYVMSFIEKNDASKNYYNDSYKVKIEPQLRKVSLDNFKLILGYQELKKLLINNSPALSLVDLINKKKNGFDNYETNKTLIESLKVTKWNSINLIPISDEVLNQCFQKYSVVEKSTSQNNNNGDEITSTISQIKENKSESNQKELLNENLTNNTKIIDYQKSFNNFKLIVFALFALFFIAIIFVLFKISKSREYIIKQVLGSKRIKEKFTANNNYQSSKVKKTYNLNDKDVNLIVDRVLECIQINEKENQSISDAKNNNDLLKPVTKYLKGKSGKIFSRIEHSPENSFFRILNEKNDDAQFEFFGDESEAIAKRIFSEDICNIISGNYQNANSVITCKPGRIKKLGEQWEVIQPIEIKLI